MRGRQFRLDTAVRPIRLIPAGAGQTARSRRVPSRSWAHPRGCGADGFSCDCTAFAAGSSPRVRGRPLQASPLGNAQRLIPAGAGQTRSTTSPLTGARAHPRGCGADWATTESTAFRQGSSPRVRGRLSPSRCMACAPGLIPAGAGQTRRWSCPAKPAGAHPRGCGADELVDGAGLVAVGLIPAGAGQTPPLSRATGRQPAHPRGCGADSACKSANCC